MPSPQGAILGLRRPISGPRGPIKGLRGPSKIKWAKNYYLSFWKGSSPQVGLLWRISPVAGALTVHLFGTPYIHFQQVTHDGRAAAAIPLAHNADSPSHPHIIALTRHLLLLPKQKAQPTPVTSVHNVLFTNSIGGWCDSGTNHEESLRAV